MKPNNFKKMRTPLVYAVILAVLAFIVFYVAPLQKENKITYNQMLELARQGNIKALYVSGTKAAGLTKDSNSKYSEKDLPKNNDFSTEITNELVLRSDLNAITATRLNLNDANLVSSEDYGFSWIPKTPPKNFLLELIPYVFIFGALGFVYFTMMKQQGGGGMSSFGKSKARRSDVGTETTTFADVAGADEEKYELTEMVEFLKNPKTFTEMGARIPKGVLLVGPPGTGKTLLAKAVAGEAGAPFYSISGSDFVEMYVGVGASRVRDLFATAKKTAPSIIFIDEIDAVGRHRGAGVGGGHDEREQTLNQLLVEMDGFDARVGIIVIAATNRADILDPALLRPGRFDRTVMVYPPDIKGREEILKIHSKNKPLADEVDLHILAQRTPGFTGADLENLLNEAAILAARAKTKTIEMHQAEEAIARVIAGPEKLSRVVTEKDKRLVAYHEVGHAILARILPSCDTVHEVSIIQRGQAGGYTMTLPDEETQYITKTKLLEEIVMLLGGRASEFLHIGDISSGAYSDLQRATKIAKKMVTEYGMSSKVGPVFFGGETEVFVGKDFGHARNYSEEVAATIDEEIHEIIETAYQKAIKMLQENEKAVHAITKELLERERLSKDVFEKIYLEAIKTKEA